MTKNNTKTISINVGKRNFPLFGILTIIFVVAKIMGYINWSWWLVFLPLWFPFAIVISAMAIVFIVSFLIIILDEILK